MDVACPLVRETSTGSMSVISGDCSANEPEIHDFSEMFCEFSTGDVNSSGPFLLRGSAGPGCGHFLSPPATSPVRDSLEKRVDTLFVLPTEADLY